jgi:hypothetical protein
VPFPLLLSLSGCIEAPDASLCVVYSADPNPAVFCQNMKTGATKEITLKDAHKYYAMSLADYQAVRDFHMKECGHE